MTDNLVKQTFIKVEGQKFAYQAINIVKQDGWIEFDRMNTKTNQLQGHFQFPLSKIESIETR